MSPKKTPPSPPPKRGSRDWGAAVQKARAAQGEWVSVFEQAPRSLPNAHKRGRINALKDRVWCYELITRNTHGNNADLWMRARRWRVVRAEQRAAEMAEREEA